MGSAKDGAKASKRKGHSEARNGDGGVKSGGHRKKHVETKADADADAEKPAEQAPVTAAGQGQPEAERVARSNDQAAETRADEARRTPESRPNERVKRDAPGERPEAKASNGDRPPVVSSIADAPVTVERKPFVQARDQGRLPHAGTARANVAASSQRPEGTAQDGWAERHQNQTVLQQHVEFFDQDRDGVIWPLDTYRGFYALGYGVIFSLVAAAVINGAFSYPTLPGYLPDPLFRIYISNIHKDKHGSDSGSYDSEGRFVPQKFEDIFSKYAEGRDYVTVRDVLRFLRGQRLVADPFGWFGALFEWLATYLLLWPADGRMAKEDIRRVYDGSIFYTIAARREPSKKRA